MMPGAEALILYPALSQADMAVAIHYASDRATAFA